MEFSNAPKGLSEWLICAACALWIAGLATDLAQKLRGKQGHPANDTLGRDVLRLETDLSDEKHERAREDKELHGRVTELRARVERIAGQMDKS